MTTNYQVDVKLTDLTTSTPVFEETYGVTLSKDFVENVAPKEH